MVAMCMTHNYYINIFNSFLFEERNNNILTREQLEEQLTAIILRQDHFKDVKPHEIIKAIERISKMRGYDKETVEIHGTVERLGDRELVRELAKALDMLGLPRPKQVLIGPGGVGGEDAEE